MRVVGAAGGFVIVLEDGKFSARWWVYEWPENEAGVMGETVDRRPGSAPQSDEYDTQAEAVAWAWGYDRGSRENM